MIALKLKEIFGLDDVNELPIAYNIAWYEQKSGNRITRPTLPSVKKHSLRTDIASVLVAECSQKYWSIISGIAGIGSVDEDMELFLGK